MCGIACYLGKNKEEGLRFGAYSEDCLKHRGPDDKGLYADEDVVLAHRRLSILDLSQLGHQPMYSSCGRYIIVYNGEIYNHLELRKKHLRDHPFRGHSDTETIVELFRLKKEKMLDDMVGMWAIIIWDRIEKRLFISRSRLGQKPLYVRDTGKAWLFASEIKPLMAPGESMAYDPTAVIEYLALGNYGHLGNHTFFKDIWQFPGGSYAWLHYGQPEMEIVDCWKLPDIRQKDKVPFDKTVKNELHDIIVEAVLSVTLSDVPIGITLSGGVDSSVIAGILASYYDKETHIFTAQSPNSAFDETRYVNAVLNKYPNNSFIVHRANLDQLSLKENLEKYIRIQEEPFGDPSIIAHGFLMGMAAQSGIKVILNGQGADELFFGYNNMAQAILLHQLRSAQLSKFSKNLNAMKLGRGYFFRTLLKAFFPGLEFSLRTKSRIRRRDIIKPDVLKDADNSLITLYKYNNIYDVWQESLYGVHIPHLVHYDDRNAMAYSIEGRMPFLDHRISEFVATIRPDDFLKNGMRKYILRESCRQYIPDAVYNRKDKIGFYTPLVNMLIRDEDWVSANLMKNGLLSDRHARELVGKLKARNLSVNDALQIWRGVSAKIWMNEYNVPLN
jgi:asparagine synthase (glutamine-hydrolysing)